MCPCEPNIVCNNTVLCSLPEAMINQLLYRLAATINDIEGWMDIVDVGCTKVHIKASSAFAEEPHYIAHIVQHCMCSNTRNIIKKYKIICSVPKTMNRLILWTFTADIWRHWEVDGSLRHGMYAMAHIIRNLPTVFGYSGRDPATVPHVARSRTENAGNGRNGTSASVPFPVPAKPARTYGNETGASIVTHGRSSKG